MALGLRCRAEQVMDNPADDVVPDPPYHWFCIQFQASANGLAVKFGGTVWLVGSALVRESPRDYDVRVIISERDRLRLFGKVDTELSVNDQWSRAEWLQRTESLKQSRRMSDRYRKNIDVQIQTEEEAKRYVDDPAVRLDSAPDDLMGWPGKP